MRRPRAQSESHIYHVITRGTGRQNIFEDDPDRHFFLNLLNALLTKHQGKLLAWCLMGNHVHLLLKTPLPSLSLIMQQLKGRYAQRFNARHGRIGHLFSGRYKSIPIHDDAHLMAVVRYIHQNPVRAGISTTCNYRWSSFPEYIGSPTITDTSFVASIFADRVAFVAGHLVPVCAAEIRPDATSRLSDDDARRIASRVAGSSKPQAIGEMPKRVRDRILGVLRGIGLSIRQLERLTGIGRGIIQRCRPATSDEDPTATASPPLVESAPAVSQSSIPGFRQRRLCRRFLSRASGRHAAANHYATIAASACLDDMTSAKAFRSGTFRALLEASRSANARLRTADNAVAR